MTDDHLSLPYCPICKRVEIGGMLIHGTECPKNKGGVMDIADMIQKERRDVYHAMDCARTWKQAAKHYRELFFDDYESGHYAKREWKQAQADADRRLELLKEVIDKGHIGFSAMSYEYHWSIPTELKEKIEKELASDT